MGKHDVSRMVPSLFHPELAARNGRLPTAAVFMRLAKGYNAVATKQRKCVFIKHQCFRDMQTGAGSPVFVWPFYFRTGENVTAITCNVGLTKTSSIFPGIASAVVVDVYRASDDVRMNVGLEGSCSFGGSSTGVVIGCRDISHKAFRIGGLAPNTEYYCETRCLFGARLAYMMVHETMLRFADDTIGVVTNPSGFVREGPIKSKQIHDLAQAAKLLWRHNAGHLFSWCSNYQEDTSVDPHTTSSSFVDLLPTNVEMLLNTYMRGTLQRPDAIPVKIAVKARRVSGSGQAAFRIFDGTNQIAITTTTLTSAKAWFTGTGTLSGTPTTWRMQLRSIDGSSEIRAMAFCGFQFET